ncbi:MAG TPA: S4 domain-containing protein [Chthoniobacteraceae bacterium]|nr:S4 domain-containing protein [Chthoniobacteraceae bacterium]
MRLDQWLWAVRVFKTRSVSTAMIKDGRVQVDGRVAKPAHPMKAGEVVTIRMDQGEAVWTRTLRMIAAPPSRIGAKLLPEFAAELTPPEEFAKRRRPLPNLLPPGFRLQGHGRPTKRDRRAIDELSGEGQGEG